MSHDGDYILSDGELTLTIWANCPAGDPDGAALLRIEETHPGDGEDDDELPPAVPANGDGSFLVPQHKAADVCRAIYAKAGLPVPDLPEVLDEAEVRALMSILHRQHWGDQSDHECTPADGCDSRAREIISAGWRKQEQS